MAARGDNYPWVVEISEHLGWKEAVQIGAEYFGFNVTNMLNEAADSSRAEAKKVILNRIAGMEKGKKVS